MATTRSAAQGILADDNADAARGDHRAAQEGLLDGDRDGDELHRELDQPRRRPRPGDHRVAPGGHPGGARPRAAVRRRASRSSTASSRARWTSRAEQTYLQPPEHQTDIVHVIKGVIEAETGAIEHYNRDHRGDRRRRPGDQRHGHRDPPRRGGPPPPVRGLPARVRGRGHGLIARPAAPSRRPGVARLGRGPRCRALLRGLGRRRRVDRVLARRVGLRRGRLDRLGAGGAGSGTTGPGSGGPAGRSAARARGRARRPAPGRSVSEPPPAGEP